jgi:tRNA nucleotidyltransferase (CCA-adding enzyme)
MKEQHPDAAIRRLCRLRLLRFLHPRLSPGERTERLLAVIPQTIGVWKRRWPELSLDRPLLWVMALLAHASASAIAGTIQRLQLSATESRALEWAGQKTSRIAKTLSSDAFLRPSQIYRLLSRLPNEAFALVLAKGLVNSKAVGIARLKRRLTRFLECDRHTTTTINGDTLKEFGLRPGPHFKKILDRLLDERLDGRITAAAQERDRARTLAKQYS